MCAKRFLRGWLLTPLVVAGVCTLAGCGERIEPASQDHWSSRVTLATFAGGVAPPGPLVVTHGGAGSPATWSRECRQAAQRGWDLRGQGIDALDRAVAAVVTLEDVPFFNAGTGANIRLDGRTVQMDAAVMTSNGDFAAVAALERVRNPILVARAVLDTPHRLLVGAGATRFAHRLGFADELPICPESRSKYRTRVANLLDGTAGGGYDDFDWRAVWNYESPPPTAPPLEDGDAADGAVGDTVGDTVGAVTRDAEGRFAAALSTGGTSITLCGRVGDVPIYGCGCYAGPAGAVACTGFGEEIIRHTMARTVYELMAAGRSARAAVRAGCLRFSPDYALGVIAVGHDDWAVAANRSMAWGQAQP